VLSLSIFSTSAEETKESEVKMIHFNNDDYYFFKTLDWLRYNLDFHSTVKNLREALKDIERRHKNRPKCYPEEHKKIIEEIKVIIKKIVDLSNIGEEEQE
jgi:hypothetical protein